MDANPAINILHKNRLLIKKIRLAKELIHIKKLIIGLWEA